jgi:NTE family protein
LQNSRRLPPNTIVVDSIRIEPVRHYSNRAVADRLRIRTGDTLRVDVLTNEIERVYALGVFQQVGFDVTEQNGRTVLHIEPVEKPWGPNFLRLGFGLLNATEGHSRFDLTVNYTMTGIGSLDADVRSEIQLGALRRIFGEYFQPLPGPGRLFVAPAVEARERTTAVDVGPTRLGDYDIERIAVNLDVGRQIESWGQVRLGVRRTKVDAEPDVRLGGRQFENIEMQVAARVIVDGLDDVAFPSDGLAGRLAVSQVNVSSPDSITADHARVEANLLVARTLGPHTLLAGLEGRASIAAPLPVYDRFPLGGLFRLSGLEPDDITGDAVGLVRLLYFNRTSSAGSLGLGGGLRLGGSLEIGNTWNYREASLGDLRIAGSAFAAFDTLMGPLYLAYGVADRGRKSWYIMLGQGVL